MERGFDEQADFEDEDKLASKTLYYLLKVLQNTTDELYFLCDFKSSIEFCDRVALILSSGAADFSELRDRLDRLRVAEAEHLRHQTQEHTEEEGLTSSISWNVSVHTPAKVKQKFKKQAIRPKIKRPAAKPKASSSGSVKNSDDSGKRWDEYSDELDLGLDLTESIPLVIQGFNEVVSKGGADPFPTPSKVEKLPDRVEDTKTNHEIKPSPKLESKSLLDLPHGSGAAPYLSLVTLREGVDVPTSPEPYRGIFREGAPRPSDLHTPTTLLQISPDLRYVEAHELNWAETGDFSLETIEAAPTQDREATFSPDSDTSNTATWSETVDMVLSGPAGETETIGWLKALPEDERGPLMSFFLQTAWRHGELRENVKSDMKRKFGLTGMQVEDLYSVLVQEKSEDLEDGDETHELDIYKKDPGRRSLSLAAERESQSSLPFFAYERTAWMNAKRLEHFRAKQKRLFARKRIWEELKKERDATEKRREYVEQRTESSRKWEERKELIEAKRVASRRKKEQEMEERSRKARQNRKEREKELSMKAVQFENRKREIKLLHELEDCLEAKRLHHKEMVRDQKAQEALQRKIEARERKHKIHEERRAEVHMTEKEKEKELLLQVKKRHFESKLRLMERAQVQKFKSESDLSLISVVIDRKKERESLSKSIPATSPEIFDLPLPLEEDLGETTGHEWSTFKIRPRSRSLNRSKSKRQQETRRHSVTSLAAFVRAGSSKKDDEDIADRSEASTTPTVHSIELDPVDLEENEVRRLKSKRLLDSVCTRCASYYESQPPRKRKKLGWGGKQLTSKARRYVDSSKKLLTQLKQQSCSLKNEKSLEVPLTGLLKALAERDWLKASMCTDLLSDVLDISIPLLSHTDRLSVRVVKLLGQIVLLCIAFNIGARRHVFFSHIGVFLELIPRFTLQYLETTPPAHHPLLPHMTHTFSTLLSSPYSDDDPKFVAQIKRDILQYFSVSGYIRSFVELISKMMETIPIESIENEWPIVYKLVTFVESLTRVDFGQDPVSEDIKEMLRTTDFAGMFAILGWVTFGVPVATKHDDFEKLWRKPLSDAQLKIFVSALKVINNFGSIRLPMFFTVVETLQVEIYHLLNFTLNYAAYHIASQTQHTSNLAHEILCFASLCRSPLHRGRIIEIFRWGKGTPLIHVLCEFPFTFFLTPEGQRELFPTLITITYNNEDNTNLLMRKLNPTYLANFLKRCLRGQNSLSKSKSDSEDARCLRKVFEIELWKPAYEFYVGNSSVTFIYSKENG